MQFGIGESAGSALFRWDQKYRQMGLPETIKVRKGEGMLKEEWGQIA
jgi:hypothetical protein